MPAPSFEGPSSAPDPGGDEEISNKGETKSNNISKKGNADNPQCSNSKIEEDKEKFKDLLKDESIANLIKEIEESNLQDDDIDDIFKVLEKYGKMTLLDDKKKGKKKKSDDEKMHKINQAFALNEIEKLMMSPDAILAKEMIKYDLIGEALDWDRLLKEEREEKARKFADEWNKRANRRRSLKNQRNKEKSLDPVIYNLEWAVKKIEEGNMTEQDKLKIIKIAEASGYRDSDYEEDVPSSSEDTLELKEEDEDDDEDINKYSNSPETSRCMDFNLFCRGRKSKKNSTNTHFVNNTEGSTYHNYSANDQGSYPSDIQGTSSQMYSTDMQGSSRQFFSTEYQSTSTNVPSWSMGKSPKPGIPSWFQPLFDRGDDFDDPIEYLNSAQRLPSSDDLLCNSDEIDHVLQLIDKEWTEFEKAKRSKLVNCKLKEDDNGLNIESTLPFLRRQQCSSDFETLLKASTIAEKKLSALADKLEKLEFPWNKLKEMIEKEEAEGEAVPTDDEFPSERIKKVIQEWGVLMKEKAKKTKNEIIDVMRDVRMISEVDSNYWKREQELLFEEFATKRQSRKHRREYVVEHDEEEFIDIKDDMTTSEIKIEHNKEPFDDSMFDFGLKNEGESETEEVEVMEMGDDDEGPRKVIHREPVPLADRIERDLQRRRDRMKKLEGVYPSQPNLDDYNDWQMEKFYRQFHERMEKESKLVAAASEAPTTGVTTRFRSGTPQTKVNSPAYGMGKEVYSSPLPKSRTPRAELNGRSTPAHPPKAAKRLSEVGRKDKENVEDGDDDDHRRKSRGKASEKTNGERKSKRGLKEIADEPVKKKSTGGRGKKQQIKEIDEPTYCICSRISFGEMIGCDNDKCELEWFHFECVNLTTKPKGKWYCPNCRHPEMGARQPKTAVASSRSSRHHERT